MIGGLAIHKGLMKILREVYDSRLANDKNTHGFNQFKISDIGHFSLD
jgi:hypothetical protein